jgi:hypothetical protein
MDAPRPPCPAPQGGCIWHDLSHFSVCNVSLRRTFGLVHFCQRGAGNNWGRATFKDPGSCSGPRTYGGMSWSFPTMCAVAGVALMATGASGDTSSRPTAFHHATPPRSFGGEGLGGDGGGSHQMSRLPSRDSRAASPIERMKSGVELRKSTLRRPLVRTHAVSLHPLPSKGRQKHRLSCFVFLAINFGGGRTEAPRGGVGWGGGWRCSAENVLHAKMRRAAPRRRRSRLETRRVPCCALLRLAVQGCFLQTRS